MQARARDATATAGHEKRVRRHRRRCLMPVPRTSSPYQTAGIYAIRPRLTTY